LSIRLKKTWELQILIFDFLWEFWSCLWHSTVWTWIPIETN
jgi:hypothetical protein